MSETKIVELIKTSRTVGSGQSSDDAVHEHTQYFAKDGALVFEKCDYRNDCTYLPDND